MRVAFPPAGRSHNNTHHLEGVSLLGPRLPHLPTTQRPRGLQLKKEILSNVITGALVVAALVMSVSAVRRSLITNRRGPSISEPRKLDTDYELTSVGHVIGPEKASVKIVEFSDFQCPGCGAMQRILAVLRERHPDVAVVFRHWPLRRIHPHAYSAALAAECAGEQGRFEPYADALYGEQWRIGVKPWDAFARDVGVQDLAGFQQCLDEARYANIVTRDLETAEELQLSATPTIIVNGFVLVAPPLAMIEDYIQRR